MSIEEPSPAAPNRCLPIREWPAQDRAAWEAAIRLDDPLEPGGPAAHWAPVSQSETAKGYGRWLGWLDHHALLDPRSPFGERVTAERIRAYLAELQTVLAPHTVASRIMQLACALKVMAPEGDWGWLGRAAARLRDQAVSSRNKRSRLQTNDRLIALGEELMTSADLMTGSPKQQAIRYRNGLIIALLAHRSMRMRNLNGIAMGKNLVQRGGIWWLVFAADETKTKRPLEMPIATDMAPWLERYLTIYRPFLLSRGGRQPPPATDALWISRNATPMVSQSLAYHIKQHTAAAFGAWINPHLFRDCAATSIAIHDPEHVRIIATVLGHSTIATSEKHYNQARGLEAGRRYHGTIERLRARTQPGWRARRQSNKRGPT